MSIREPMPMLDLAVRCRSFDEVNLGLTAAQAQAEAQRCQSCASAPCAEACPLGNDIPSFLAAIADGRFADAVFQSSVPLTAVCGRVCYRPCERACLLNLKSEGVAINALERFAADSRLAFEERPTAACRERVAIVGSGPAGAACAYDLRRAGCRVAVFEAAPVPGGMLWLGIPAYRLPRDIINNEFDVLRKLGVHFVFNHPIGPALPLDLLQRGFDAVFVAVGAHRGRKLGVPGDDAPGVVDAVAFLRRVNLGNVEVPGKRVVIVGGGDSAMDTARTAIRLGCEKVTILYRRSRNEMPANPGELEEAEAEGVEVILLAAPTRVITNGDGRVNALECVRMRLGAPDSSGRARPEPMAGSEFLLETDCVIPAVSQDPDLAALPADPTLKRSRWETLEVNAQTLETSMPGVFAGGDAVSGPRTVAEAMAMGRKAAATIVDYLIRRSGGSPQNL